MHAGEWFGLVMIGAVAGCSFNSGEPVAYAEINSATINDTSFYPHTTFEGREVYLVGKTWMFKDGARWAYYREEPDLLRRHRLIAIEHVDPSTIDPRPKPSSEERRELREDRVVRER